MRLSVQVADTEALNYFLSRGDAPYLGLGRRLGCLHDALWVKNSLKPRSPELLRVLLNAGAHPDDTDRSNHTPLFHLTVYASQHFPPRAITQMLNELLNRGATPNYQEHDTHTILTNTSYPLAEVLLIRGANANARDPWGNTALYRLRKKLDLLTNPTSSTRAVVSDEDLSNTLQVCRLLISHGATLSCDDREVLLKLSQIHAWSEMLEVLG